MKRLSTKIITIAACAAMMLSVPFANTQTVQAAVKAQGTVNLTTKKLSIPKGTSTVIKNNTLTMVKGRRYAVKFKINGKAYNLATLPTTVGKAKVNTTAIASIKSNLLTANKAGTTTFRIVKGTKNLVSLKVKVIDTAHKHSWKNITKATCATKGKKLCKTCGATGTTAMSKTHSFKVTKKATCERKGVETCTVCGLQNALPKTAHKYVTETGRGAEGRGKKWNAYTIICPGCHWDMTDWTNSQRDAHQHHIDAILENKLDIGCFNSGFTGVAGELRYEKYMLVETTDTYCEYCGGGEQKKTTEKDLYYCNKNGKKLPAGETDPWASWSYENYCKEHGFVLCDNPSCENYNLEVMAGHECPGCHIVPSTNTPASTAKKAAAKRPAVASPQDVITDVPDNNTVTEDANLTVSGDETLAENIVAGDSISENEAVSSNAVSENSISENTISDNEIVIDSDTVIDNTDITDLETGGDVVLENQDDEGIIIEDIDETDEQEETKDDGIDDYDDSEGIVIEDE